MASLNFKGKSAVWNHHLSVPYHTLDKDKKSSLSGAGENENLIIEGDNLLALKALLPKYQGKVKCIYIDPPYNTGNEGWVYSDNVSNPIIKEWIGETVGKEGEDLTRHNKWLCMMTPRLKLLRELLSDDGVIFVSIDDNEQHHLKILMDEIFREENFVANIVWQKKYSPQNDAKYFSDMHDFIVVYAKHKNIGTETNGWIRNLISRTEDQNARYKNPDNDPRGVWKSSDLSVKTYSKSYDYPITTPSGRIVNPPQGRCWRTSKESFLKMVNENRIWFGPKKDGVPSLKRFLSEVQEGTVPVTLWLRDEVGDNQEARQEIKELFKDVEFPFETPKPTRLIKRILQIGSGKDSIVLDSFAGSATTGNAVLDLNKEDGGNRKFILVEMESYAKTVTAERIKKAISKFGYHSGFTYYKLGPSVDGKSILDGKNLPTWENFAKYVHYLATGNPIDEVKKPTATWEIVSKTKHTGVYLIYKDKVEDLKNLAITRDWLEKVKGKEGKKIVYAPACFLDKEVLDEHHIAFVQIPFNLFQRK